MNAKSRMLALNLLSKQEKNPDLAKAIGIKVNVKTKRRAEKWEDR